MSTHASSEEEPVICLGGCKRQLTSRTSRARGYGEDCWRKLHGHPTRQPRATSTATAKPGPGQAELPLDDQLALWTT